MANKIFIIPNTETIRSHWWSSLFVHLKDNSSLFFHNDDEKLFARKLQIQFNEFKRPISQKYCDNIIYAKSGFGTSEIHLLKKIKNWNDLTNMISLDEIFNSYIILLVSLNNNKVIELYEEYTSFITETHMTNERALESVQFRSTFIIELISELAEFCYKTRYGIKSKRVILPLTVILCNTGGNKKILRRYYNLVQRYLKTFLLKSDVLVFNTPFKENPTFDETLSLATEIGSNIKRIIQ